MALETLMQALLDCAETALNDANVKPTLISLIPGGSVAWDNCDCGGQLYVRVNPLNPAARQGNCGPATLTANLYVGVIRCSKALNDDGTPPSADVMNAETHQMLADMELLLAAITCCFAKDRAGVTIGTWTPQGAGGGCVGGEWRVDVTYTGVCECPDG